MESVPATGAAGNGGRLPRLDAAQLDVVVVGGGITGACVAWHAARAGLAVALVERDDFGAGATANCLKIVHGGLRYLQHADLRRMRQSIAERSAWLRSAPHLVEPLPVVMPTWRGAFPPRALLAGALAINELVSADRNRGVQEDRRIPRSRVLSRRECASLVPELDAPGLTGGILFHDALMYSPERLTLEVVEAARRAGAIVMNHMELVGVSSSGGRLTAARLRHRLTAADVEVRTHWIVNATGSAAGPVAGRLLGRPPAAPQQYSVALNLVTRQPARAVAFTVAAGAADPDRVVRSGSRQLFVVPWRGQTLVGTAHVPYSGDPAAFELRDEHLDGFHAELAAASPGIELDRDDVVVVHRGLLPVAGGGAAGTSHGAAAGVRLLKRHRVLDHAADGLRGVLSVVSVKFTTAQVLARDVVARIARGRGDTDAPLLLPGAAFASLDALRAEVRAAYGDVLPHEVIEHLIRSHGARWTEVVATRTTLDGWDRRVVPDAPVIRAQLLHGVVAEMAATVDDLLWRRTEIGPRGLITADARREAERVLAHAAAGPNG